MRGCSCFEGTPPTPHPATRDLCLDTTCRNCGHAIQHTGAGGIAWIIKGSVEHHTGSRADRTWECRCKESGALFHAHAPVDVVTEREVAETLASIERSMS